MTGKKMSRNMHILFTYVLFAITPNICSAEITVVGGTDFNFGEVGRGTMLTHTFQLQNTSGKAIKISKVRKNCECIVTESPETIEPGSIAKLSIKFFAEGRSGNLKYKMMVHTNYSSEPIVLSVSAKVVYDLDYSPTRIDRFSKMKGEEKTFEVFIRNESSNSLVIKSVESSDPNILSANLKDTIINPVGQEVLILDVTLSKNNNIGEISEELRIYTSSKISPVISIPVKGTIKDNYAISSPTAFLGISSRNDELKKTLKLTYFYPKNIKLLSAKSKYDIVSVKTMKTQGKENSFNISIAMKNQSYIGEFKDVVSIKCSDPDIGEVKIPVFGYILAKKKE